ncbi:MAG: hypothetical protein K9I85_02700 [Saprospiraceae bacterium]|nr:hypothetical protein [Saprospiraceae bacterium]
MQSFVLLLDCPTREQLLECIHVSSSFLRSRTPKRREKVRIILLDPPGPIFNLLEEIRSTGFEYHFQVLHRSDTLLFQSLRTRVDVWLTGSRITPAWLMNEICQRGKILINYSGKLAGGDLQASWYFAIKEGHPQDRKTSLTNLLNKLYEDPEAVRWLRRYAHQHYNQYCNRMTSANLIQSMDRTASIPERLSA